MPYCFGMQGLETPAETAARALALLRDEAFHRQHADQTVLCVTHSIIIESLLATLIGKHYDGISMRRLAWIRVQVPSDGGELKFEHLDGFTFANEVSMHDLASQ